MHLQAQLGTQNRHQEQQALAWTACSRTLLSRIDTLHRCLGRPGLQHVFLACVFFYPSWNSYLLHLCEHREESQLSALALQQPVPQVPDSLVGQCGLQPEPNLISAHRLSPSTSRP